MNGQKTCESTYIAAHDPCGGPDLHGAAVIDRSSGTAHYWMVRGLRSECVISVLEQQIRQARSRPPRRKDAMGRELLGALLAAGILALLASGRNVI